MISILFLFVCSAFSWANNIEFNSEVSFIDSYKVSERDSLGKRIVLMPEVKIENESQSYDFKGSFLYWHNFTESDGRQYEVIPTNVLRIHSLYVSKYLNNWVFRLGWEVLENGETMGAHRPNYLNPVSFENYAFDAEKIREVAQPAAHIKYIFNDSAVEYFYVIKNEKIPLPLFIANGTVADGEPDRVAFRDTEQSVRLRTYFSEIGLESTFLYSQHFSRVPVYTLQSNPEGKDVYKVFSKKMESASISINKAWEQWVLRADVTYHKDMPFMRFSSSDYIIKDLYDGAAGLEYSYGEKRSLITQLHYVNNNEPESPLYYGSIWLKESFWRDKFDVSLGYYSGLGNGDSHLVTNLNYDVGEQWSLGVGFMQFHSRSGGFFQLLEGEDQIQLTLKFLN
ncbi:MAG: hypothetical protein OM95_08850 [Bdellovibrio sp. ArHS]|uniref:hypothetical protein n=1 Tax=Bdellovibrio sp. ArHS TaxID=1569284 RepID=UPI0005827796|nr:hypothetical protein [Bdellovibrio sp. ArHS]KHD88260.1 MAG: hypothetical protein OM95_08850 [Bdellovibrio sp. ArHS]